MRTQQAGASSRPAAYHNITVIDAMPAEGLTTQEEKRFAYRNIEYRLLPGSKANGAKLDGLAGACRYVWNRVRAEIEEEYREGKEAEEKPSLSHFSLFKRFTALRREVDWLPEYASAIVRYTLKYQADAWTAFFKKAGETHKGENPYRKNGLRKGTPNFKSKLRQYTVVHDSRAGSRSRTGSCTSPRWDILGNYILCYAGNN